MHKIIFNHGRVDNFLFQGPFFASKKLKEAQYNAKKKREAQYQSRLDRLTRHHALVRKRSHDKSTPLLKF